MSTAAKRYSVAEYLALEELSEIRHEYFDGEIFALAGGTASHGLISNNIAAELHHALKARGCRVYPSDVRILCPTGLRTYPDQSIVCEKPRFEDEKQTTLLNPVVIVEVLSESTEAYDRGRKFSNYQTIESLRECVLIAQDRYHIDHYARQPNGQWLLTTVTDKNASLELPVLECSIPLVEIYAHVTFTEQPSPTGETGA